jgi:hypothetical protein
VLLPSTTDMAIPGTCHRLSWLFAKLLNDSSSRGLVGFCKGFCSVVEKSEMRESGVEMLRSFILGL